MKFKLLAATTLLISGAAFAQTMPSLETVMNDCDTNKDGFITREEVEPLTGPGHKFLEIFDKLDVNKDNKVDVEEMKAMFKSEKDQPAK